MVINLLKNLKTFNMRYFYLLILINSIFPCAVCYGAPDHPVTEGINNAVIFLLFITSFVLLCIGTSIFLLIKKTKKVELTRSLHDR